MNLFYFEKVLDDSRAIHTPYPRIKLCKSSVFFFHLYFLIDVIRNHPICCGSKIAGWSLYLGFLQIINLNQLEPSLYKKKKKISATISQKIITQFFALKWHFGTYVVMLNWVKTSFCNLANFRPWSSDLRFVQMIHFLHDNFSSQIVVAICKKLKTYCSASYVSYFIQLLYTI